MGHMKVLWQQEHSIDAQERARKHAARQRHKQGLITRRQLQQERAEIETQAANLRSDMFEAYLKQ